MANDLAEQHPVVLAEMQKMFLGEAAKYKVLPLDDRREELFNPKLAGRPDLMFGRTELTLYEGMNGLLENDFINVKNASVEIVADVDSGEDTANGVIVAQGGRFGGWSLYVIDGVPAYTYNYLGLSSTTATSSEPLPKGRATIKMDFAYDGGKLGAGGTVTLYINDKAVGTSTIEKTQPAIFSPDEGAGVGNDLETTVSDAYTPSESTYSGKIEKVTINVSG